MSYQQQYGNPASPYQQRPQASSGGYQNPPPNQYTPQQQYAAPPQQYGQATPGPQYTTPHGYGAPSQQQQQYQPYSPYSQPAQQAPPQGADPQLWLWFKAVDTDGSGSLTSDELGRALINGDWSPFNSETVRLMMNMFDSDNSGTINFNEFAGLWKYIEDWKKCFQTFDADGSGTINFEELKTALRTFGYNLSDNFIHLLIKKYDKYAGTKNTTGRQDVTFDNFVQICVTVKTLTDSFRRFDTDSDGWIQISYEQFLELVVSNR